MCVAANNANQRELASKIFIEQIAPAHGYIQAYHSYRQQVRTEFADDSVAIEVADLLAQYALTEGLKTTGVKLLIEGGEMKLLPAEV